MQSQKTNFRGKSSDGMPNPIDIYVGQRICLRRRLLRLSQADMAEKLGITFQQVQKYEHGINRISASRLWDFGRVLGVDIGFFYEDMPADIAGKSPRLIYHSGEENEHGCPACLPENTMEGQELLQGYFNIDDRKVALCILDLIKNLAKNKVI